MSRSIVTEPVVPTDADCLDLSALLAPLSRDDVELMLVRMLDKHPQEANWIVQVARKPVDTLEIANEVKAVCANAASIRGCCEELEINVARSSDFLRGGHVRNAVAVLEVLTPPVVSWLAEQGSPDDLDDDDDKQSLQGFLALLENAWQAAFEQAKLVASAPGTAPTTVSDKVVLTRTSGADKAAAKKAGPRPPYTTLSTAELAGATQVIQQGMNKLKNTLGAIFSDAVRTSNRRMKTVPPPAAAAAAAEGADAAAAPAAAVAGSKRKAGELEEEAADKKAETEQAPAAAAASEPAAAAPAQSKPKAAEGKPAAPAKKAKK